MGEKRNVDWVKLIRARSITPRHTFICSVLIQHRLPTKLRLSKHITQNKMTCSLCNNADEDETHLFFECPYAKEVYEKLNKWWPITPIAHTSQNLGTQLLKTKGTKGENLTTCAIVSAAIYLLWSARNHVIFNNTDILAKHTVSQTKEEVRHRILHLNTMARKYINCIDRILH